MKLLSMKLVNFKGIREADFNFGDGGNYNIYGTNGAGKTTTVDALTWLLFGKDSTDASDFGIKTIVDGEPLHHAEHSVECSFLMEDGLRTTLKKVYKEKWQQPRGNLEAKFAGHTTDHFIDDVPKSQTAYKNFINSIVDEKKFKVLTNPLYFNEKLKDEERRSILMDIIGGIDQDAILTENFPTLADLIPLLKGRKVEDYKQIVKQSLTKTKKEIDSIGPAIKENQAMMIPGADAANMGLYQDEIRRADEDITVLIRQIAEAKAGTIDSALETKKAELNRQIQAVQAQEDEMNRNAKNKLQADYDDAHSKRMEAGSRVYGWEHVVKDFEMQVRHYERKRQELLEHFQTISAQKFRSDPIETICPTCGQNIPQENVEAAKAKQEEQFRKFNLEKAEKLKAINVEGKANNEKKDDANKKLSEARESLSNSQREMEAWAEKEKAAKEKLDGYRWITLPEKETLQQELTKLQAPVNQPDQTAAKRIVELEEERQSKIAKRNDAQVKVNEIEQNRKHQARIRELQEKEKELSATFTSLTKQSYLCDQYSRCLTAYIDRKVGEHFKLARFVMFKNNVSNDGAKECCEVQMHGTPYHDLCQTEQMHVGLDIIQTLCRYYKMTMPVLIDRSESFITLPETDMQIIRLIVSADDKTLRLEKA
ncbi:MAG: AAA family ATPase [Acidaminococcaceae bacterium]|nr:AAA family ATPase [Acidaminococcaceae bacterium]